MSEDVKIEMTRTNVILDTGSDQATVRVDFRLDGINKGLETRLSFPAQTFRNTSIPDAEKMSRLLAVRVCTSAARFLRKEAEEPPA